jgi:ubiquinone biosynthesis accessory factor UbiK
MNRQSIDSLARQLADSVPEGLRAMRDDLEQNFRAILRSGLDRLDLVTREEFEVQQAVLARTREKLEALHPRLAALESASAEIPQAPKKKAPRKKASTRKKTGAQDDTDT